ncbi:MAG: hypothetical protein WC755_02890 [Candidatus Woesearchaeota archaeon]|jgi:hypothetical protein
MDIDILEVKYNNKVSGNLKNVSVSGDANTINLGFKDTILSGSISLTYDEVRLIWAKLLELDKGQSKKLNEQYTELLNTTNALANKLTLENYTEPKQKLSDMKKFLEGYSYLLEHAQIGLATFKGNEKVSLEKKESEKNPAIDMRKKFNDEVKSASDEFDKKLPPKKVPSRANEFIELLEKQEIEKRRIIEEEQKRFEELKKQADEKKENTEFKQEEVKKIYNGQQKEIHVNSDNKQVRPLFEEQKELKTYTKRSTELDNIDFSKL